MTMKKKVYLAILGGLSALLADGCGGDTYCQSGPKYGTQCYSLSDVRTPPGQRPPLSSEPPPRWQPEPPPNFGTTASPASNGAPAPLGSPAWHPDEPSADAGPD